MARARTSSARNLRIRRAKMDRTIARVKRKIKSLEKKLRAQTGILNKRQARRAKLK